MKKTIIKHVNVDLETGDLHVLMHKRQLDDGGNVLAQGNHRVVIHPDTDIDEAARVINAHLPSVHIGDINHVGPVNAAAPVDLAEWEKVKAHARLAHTPEIKARWKAQQEARLAEHLIREKLAADAKAAEDARFKAAVADAVRAMK